MKENDTCSGCTQKETCRGAYDKIGKAKGPNVALPVVIAFIVPIAVFVLTLAAAQRLLEGRLEEKTLTLVAFILAFFSTLAVIFVIRAIRGRKK